MIVSLRKALERFCFGRDGDPSSADTSIFPVLASAQLVALERSGILAARDLTLAWDRQDWFGFTAEEAEENNR